MHDPILIDEKYHYTTPNPLFLGLKLLFFVDGDIPSLQLRDRGAPSIGARMKITRSSGYRYGPIRSAIDCKIRSKYSRSDSRLKCPSECNSAPSHALLANGGANFVVDCGHGKDTEEETTTRRVPESRRSSRRHSSGADRAVEEGPWTHQ